MSKKTFMTIIIILAFLISLVAGTQAVKADSGNSITFSWGLTVSSPVNTTYYSSSPLLYITFSCKMGIGSTLNYSIDGMYQDGIPMHFQQPIDLSGPYYNMFSSLSLPRLSDGSHQLNVGIEESANNVSRSDLPLDMPFQAKQPTTFNGTEYVASWIDTVFFTIDTIHNPPPTPSSTQTSTPIPTPTVSMTFPQSTSSPAQTASPTLSLTPSLMASLTSSPALTDSPIITSSPSLTQQPTVESSAKPNNTQEYTVSILITVGLAIVIVTAVAGALFYSKKRKG